MATQLHDIDVHALYTNAINACGRSDNARTLVRAWALGYGTCYGLRDIPNRSWGYAISRAKMAVLQAGLHLEPKAPSRRLALFAPGRVRVTPVNDI